MRTLLGGTVDEAHGAVDHDDSAVRGAAVALVERGVTHTEVWRSDAASERSCADHDGHRTQQEGAREEIAKVPEAAAPRRDVV
jgi:hypothetical protein